MAFPVSEVIVSDVFEEQDHTIWECLVRMVQLVFHQGRDGWTKDITMHNFPQAGLETQHSTGRKTWIGAMYCCHPQSSSC